ncbi:hypothetical protein LZK73_00120 [Neorhizobium galegae]|nr:hypothetical protein LZK73_00120 [Neorhizobium galegae]
MTALPLDRSTLDMRRGACPALSAPMQTGDGLLARVALIDVITPGQLAEASAGWRGAMATAFSIFPPAATCRSGD